MHSNKRPHIKPKSIVQGKHTEEFQTLESTDFNCQSILQYVLEVDDEDGKHNIEKSGLCIMCVSLFACRL